MEAVGLEPTILLIKSQVHCQLCYASIGRRGIKPRRRVNKTQLSNQPAATVEPIRVERTPYRLKVGNATSYTTVP